MRGVRGFSNSSISPAKKALIPFFTDRSAARASARRRVTTAL
jgi:hypothetical protein